MDAVAFTRMARGVAILARERGLVPPTFTSPPRSGTRSMRRRDDGSVVVAVARADREPSEVAADLVDGVLAANGVDDAALRGQLIGELAG